jgi:hypothetical protein
MPHSPDYQRGYADAMARMRQKLQSVEQDRLRWVRQYGKVNAEKSFLQQEKDDLQAEYDTYVATHP